jgi:hypothetical protein
MTFQMVISNAGQTVSLWPQESGTSKGTTSKRLSYFLTRHNVQEIMGYLQHFSKTSAHLAGSEAEH